MTCLMNAPSDLIEDPFYEYGLVDDEESLPVRILEVRRLEKHGLYAVSGSVFGESFTLSETPNGFAYSETYLKLSSRTRAKIPQTYFENYLRNTLRTRYAIIWKKIKEKREKRKDKEKKK